MSVTALNCCNYVNLTLSHTTMMFGISIHALQSHYNKVLLRQLTLAGCHPREIYALSYSTLQLTVFKGDSRIFQIRTTRQIMNKVCG